MRKKKSTSMLLGLLAVSLVVTPCYGSATKNKISAAQSAQKESQKQLNAAQGRIDSLESKKGDLEAYLTELNQQLSELGEKLQDIQVRSEKKQKELGKLEKDLEAAEETEAAQYSSMKLRIQYMYENADSSYFVMLLESETLADFLSQASNMTELTKYDRKMLEEYKKTTAVIKDKKNCIKEEQKELEQLKQESLEQQEEITAVVKNTHAEIESYESKISAEQGNARSLLNQISNQKDVIDALIKQEKDEEAAAKQPGNTGNTGKPVNPGNNQKPETNKPETNKPEEKPDGGSTAKPPQENNNTESNDQSSGGNSSSNEKYLGKFSLTAYCNGKCCGGSDSGRTASGTYPSQGRTVAMGGVPFGTKLRINGNIYIVEDRGVPYGHVDIYFESHADALRFGRKSADVYQVN